MSLCALFDTPHFIVGVFACLYRLSIVAWADEAQFQDYSSNTGDRLPIFVGRRILLNMTMQTVQSSLANLGRNHTAPVL
jgi:hypothetical protein